MSIELAAPVLSGPSTFAWDEFIRDIARESSPLAELISVSAQLDIDPPADVLPMKLIEKYVTLAVARAEVTHTEGGMYFAEVPLLQGTWAEGETHSDAVHQLRDVVREWILLKILDGDRDFPVVMKIDLNVIRPISR